MTETDVLDATDRALAAAQDEPPSDAGGIYHVPKRNEIAHTFTHRECRIYCLKADGEFSVPLTGTTYDSLVDAKAAIDAAAETRKRMAMKRPKMDVKVVDNDCVTHTLTGVHVGHGKVLATPPINGWNPDVYVDTPVVMELLAKQKDMRRRRHACEKALKPFKLELQKGDDGRRIAESPDERAERIARQAGEKLAKAKRASADKLFAAAFRRASGADDEIEL